MIIEMRTYTLRPGTAAAFEERFVEGLSARLQFSKLGGLWRSEVGGLNQVVHLWPYESFEARERIGNEARKTGKWPPKTQEFIILQENKIIQPAPFSPSLEERKLGNLYEFPQLSLLEGRRKRRRLNNFILLEDDKFLRLRGPFASLPSLIADPLTRLEAFVWPEMNHLI